MKHAVYLQVLNCINGGNTRNIQNGENCANGGLATDAWLWANSNGGVTTESQLPYLAGENGFPEHPRTLPVCAHCSRGCDCLIADQCGSHSQQRRDRHGREPCCRSMCRLR